MVFSCQSTTRKIFQVMRAQDEFVMPGDVISVDTNLHQVTLGPGIMMTGQQSSEASEEKPVIYSSRPGPLQRISAPSSKDTAALLVNYHQKRVRSILIKRDFLLIFR